MNGTEWNDLLDLALARLEAESLADILADYPAEAGELRPLLLAATSLQILRPVTLPPTEAQAARRAAFLAQVEQLPRLAVSPTPVVRLKEWVTNRLTQFSGQIWPPKETKRMNALLLRATLMIVLLLGTVGGTAVLSADSLPDSLLYPVKLAVEDTRLGLATDPAAEAALNLALAETRLQEIVAMSQAGKVLDEAVINRLENHFDAALQLAAQMPDEAMIGFLVQTRDRIRTQENDLAQAQERVSGAGEASLEQANGLLNRLRLQIENGLQEPQLFRRQHGHMPEGMPREAGPCNDGNCEPTGNANQYGQDPANEGHNGASYGDGNCGDAADCVPAGNANQYGQDPANEGHNGASYGDGNCGDAADCVPAGNANQYGQDPTNDGHNGPSYGDGNCDNSADCVPAGNANQYGQEPTNDGHNGPSYGDGNCDNSADCVPAGNANQYGQESTNDGHNGLSYGDGNCDNAADCVPAGDANQYGQGNGDQGQDGPEGKDTNSPSGEDEDGSGSQTGQNEGNGR